MDPFDITKAAQIYSSISVVLAGFSFAVLMYVIQSNEKFSRETSGDAERGLTFIALTFLGNVVIAVLWAMISGEPSGKMRPEIEGFVATLLFASNTPLTFQAVTLFIAATRRTSLVRLFRWTYLFTIMMATVFIVVNVAYLHAEIQAGSNGYPQPLSALHSVYGKSLIAFLAIVFLSAGLSQMPRLRFKIATEKMFIAFTYAWLAGGLALVTFFAWVSMGEPDTIVSINWLYVLAFFWSLFNGWATIFTPGVTKVSGRRSASQPEDADRKTFHPNS